MTVTVYGDNDRELELAALAYARECFGEYADLTIVPSYHVTRAVGHGSASGGKKFYCSDMTIEVH